MTPPRSGGAAWAALAAGLALASIGAWLVGGDAALIDWRPGRAAAEPWRAWSAAFVHLSPQHLSANLAGALVLGFFGWRAEVPRWAVLAWALAWPLTQAGLLARPELVAYGGLSGVLHAGVAVVAFHLVADQPGRARAIGAAVLTGLALKIALEQPFGPVLRESGGIAVAPFAHFSGAVSGVVCAVLGRLVAGPASMPPR